MRFMVIVKATQDSEAGVLPSEELLTAMGKYNEEQFTPELKEQAERVYTQVSGNK